MNHLHHIRFGIGVLGVLVIVLGVGSGLIRAVISALLNAELKAERHQPQTP